MPDSVSGTGGTVVNQASRVPVSISMLWFSNLTHIRTTYDALIDY